MAVSRRLRFEVLRRDNYTCQYCGASAPDAVLTVDHVIPTALGGGDEPNNLVTACQDCNSGKSSMPADAPIVEAVDAAALLWAKAIEQVNAQRQAQMVDLDLVLNEFGAMWTDRAPWAAQGNYSGQPTDWASTIQTFVENGITIDDLTHYMDVAFSARSVANRDRWRYFCGCIWKELGKRQEMARRLIEDGQV